MKVVSVIFLLIGISLGDLQDIEGAILKGANYVREKLLSRSGVHLQSLSAFHDFMSFHNKTYSNKEEYKMRYNVFRSNMKIVEKLQVNTSLT